MINNKLKLFYQIVISHPTLKREFGDNDRDKIHFYTINHSLPLWGF